MKDIYRGWIVTDRTTAPFEFEAYPEENDGTASLFANGYGGIKSEVDEKELQREHLDDCRTRFAIPVKV